LRGLQSWGRDASIDDLTLAARDLLTETDERRLRWYLEIFWLRPFPLEIDHLLTLMRHPNDRVMVSAGRALAQIAEPRVRAVALEILTDPALDGWHRSWGITLLAANFEAGDETLLLDLLTETDDDYGHHSLGLSTLDLLKAHPAPEAGPVLRHLYERGPC